MAKKNELLVVATQEGHYGKMRQVGEKFLLSNKSDRSKRWMIDADSKEGEKLNAEYVRTTGVTLDEDTIAQEMAQSQGGRVSVLERENARLKRELEQAQERIAQLEGESAREEKTRFEGTIAPDEDTSTDDGAGEPASGETEDAASNGEDTEPKPRARRRRRTT